MEMKKTALAALAAVSLASAFAEEDMRIPKDCYLSAVVDCDTIRKELSDDIPHWKALDVIRENCGFGPENVHRIVAAVRNYIFWMRRDEALTNFTWSAAIDADRLDWNRLESFAKAKGCKWQTNDAYGVSNKNHLVTWFRDDGYFAGSMGIGVDERDVVYTGTGGSLYAAYHGMCELDDRPSRKGKLETGEVVRVVLTDPHQVPQWEHIAYAFGLSGGLERKLGECRLSVFLADGKVRVRFTAAFADSPSATAARDSVLSEKELNFGRTRCELEIDEARKNNRTEDVEKMETQLAWLNGLRISAEGNILTVDSGSQDARLTIKMLSDLIAEVQKAAEDLLGF
ncbi:MAG: hypothetical protein K6F50_09670 [Kiritimatiellae bacterium]|nr:hypothetical protein [Kiritimatiellia bacterium]